MGLFSFMKKKRTEGPMYLYSESDMEQYEAFIEKEFGKFDDVLHEIVSPDIHLDVIVVPPTEECPYYILVTMGMGAYSMNVPKELKKYELERAELVICLPPTWNINSSKEEDYWPIKQLKSMARLPIYCNTWIGYGHTASSDENNTPYASNTKLCSMVFLTAKNTKGELLNLKLGDMGKINFYMIYPLYLEELEFKFNNSIEELMELIGAEEPTPIVNINRKNVIKP